MTIEDSSGHPVASATNTVTIALDSAGMPTDPTTVKAVNGVATFANLSFQRAGSGYTLTASSGSLTRATSVPFSITPAAPARLIVSTQASTARETQPIAPPIQVTMFDAFGNVASNATNAVTLAIGKNPGGGKLTGTTTVNAVNGVATFSNLSIDKPGAGYTLVATTPGLVSAETAAFMITGTPASIIEVGGDGQSGTIGCVLTGLLIAQVNDRNNQPVAGITVAGLGTTDANGLAKAGWVLAYHLGTQTRTASVANVGSVTFAAFANFSDNGCHYGQWPGPPAIGLSPASVSFTAPQGGANPTSQIVNVTRSGGGALGIAVGTSSSGWLTASLSGGTTPATLTINASTGSLAPGTYTASVELISAFSSGPQYVAVTFTVR